jgi:hypothetical protein
MKYYCKRCESELKLGPKVPLEKNEFCPVCKEVMYTFCDYETPEQYEKRTGKQYPGNGLVFWDGENNWFSSDYNWAKAIEKMTGKKHFIVIADPPVPPPNDWSPE